MSRIQPFAIAAALLTLGSACAADTEGSAPTTAAAERGGRQCFRPQDVNGFNPQGDDVVFLRVGANDVYRAEILGTCPDIDYSQRVAIRSRGTSWVCQGMDAEFVVPGPLGLDRCPITSIRKLSDAEVRAYREQN